MVRYESFASRQSAIEVSGCRPLASHRLARRDVRRRNRHFSHHTSRSERWRGLARRAVTSGPAWRNTRPNHPRARHVFVGLQSDDISGTYRQRHSERPKPAFRQNSGRRSGLLSRDLAFLGLDSQKLGALVHCLLDPQRRAFRLSRFGNSPQHAR